MTEFRHLLRIGAVVAAVAVGFASFAEEDLDALLSELGDGDKKVEKTAGAEAPKEESPAQKADAEPKLEEAATPAAETKAEEPAAETKAEESATETKAEDAPAETAGTKVEEPKAEESAPATAEDAKPAVAAPSAVDDAELLSDIEATERLRHAARKAQAKREIKEARASMELEDWSEAIRHYGLAEKLLGDSDAEKPFCRECEQGIAESSFRMALEEDELGRRDKATEWMKQALDRRHPKARKHLEQWAKEGDPKNQPYVDADSHQRRNDTEYKEKREEIRRHLKRSAQLLALRDIDGSLDECEIVLQRDPHNQEAIRLRDRIQRKRAVILEQERQATRDGMIADVDKAWRPVYAVNASQLDSTRAETMKAQLGEDPERTQEQEIEQRMKAMRLPAISFKPPATIIDAVDFFRQASKDYDNPEIPLEKRGFNFVLKTPEALKTQSSQSGSDDSDDFSSTDNGDAAQAGQAGVPVIPTITASDITFYEALKLVCDTVEYKFLVRGPVVMVMHKDMSTAELISRKYDVLDAFLERMTSASTDIKEMKQAGFGGNSTKKSDDGEENQERDWKEFFTQMGVKWPEGSSIMYIKTLGKLYVRNTLENLAEFEKVLQEMGSQPKLIEIETRFVEVSQEDLNSLGFEWILNNDYMFNMGDKLGRALGISKSVFGSATGSETWGSSTDINGTTSSFIDSLTSGGSTSTLTGGSETSVATVNDTYSDTRTTTIPSTSNGEGLIRNIMGERGIGLNAFGGTDSDYGNGNRYLSQTGNFISGTGESTNDQLFRLNAFLGNANLSMILHMLAQRSDTDLLSAPKVVTKSGENAVIKVVTEYIYPQDYDVQLQSSSSGSSSSSSGSSQSAILAVVEPQNFTMREVGVILDVTPTYSEANGGTIDLELKPQVVDEPVWYDYGMDIPFTGNTSSGNVLDIGGIFTGLSTALTTIGASLSEEDKQTMSKAVTASAMSAVQNLSTSSSDNMTWYKAPMKQPWFHVRSIDSKVSITPGSTVVMGGLITEARKAMDDKIPYLGDLPFIGRLFRSHAEKTTKRNLLIFVTGRLITPSGRELQNTVDEANAADDVKPAPKE